MKKVFLDTNFLLACFQFHVDIFDEIAKVLHEPYHLYVLSDTVRELESIVQHQRGKDRKAAKFSLTLIQRKGVNIYSQEKTGDVDDLLIDLSATPDIIIATQDTGLKKRLKKNCPLLTLRQKRYVVML